MFCNKFIFIFLISIIIIQISNGEYNYQFEIDKKNNERINSGRESLESIRKNSISNRCLEECMDILSNGCKEMDDLAKSRLAVKLTNCHLAKSGLPLYPCNYDMSIEECTFKMDQKSFSVYTNFYISTENICYYLSQQLFQARTEQSINNLISTTHRTQNTINTLSNKANDINDQIDHSIQNQKKLLNNQQQLINGIESSVKSIDNINLKSMQIENSILQQAKKQSELVESQNELSQQYKLQSKESLTLIGEIKQSSDTVNQQQKESLEKQNHLIQLQTQSIQFIETIEQISDSSLSKLKQLINFQDQLLDGNQVIIAVLNQLNVIQNWILSEVIDFKSIYFYISILLFIFIISSTKRTKSTRVPLIIGFLILIGTERSICSSVVSSSTIFSVLSTIFKIPIINFIWNNIYFFTGNNSTESNYQTLFSDYTNNGIPSKEYIYIMINNVRTIYMFYSFIIVLSSFWFYKDLEKQNHQLLLTILKTVEKNERKHNILKNQLYEKGILDKKNKKPKDHSLIKIDELINDQD